MNKVLVFLLLLSASLINSTNALAQLSLKKVWETADTNALRTPEAVFYDNANARIYVACMGKPGVMGDGYIALLNVAGEIITPKFTTGLDDPKAMKLLGGELWVADLTQMVVIRPQTGEIVTRVPIPGATFLNGLTMDKPGNLYVSDTRQHTVHKITPEGKISLWASGEEKLGGPNGVEVVGDELYVAGARSGRFTQWNTRKAEMVKQLADSMPRADGIISMGKQGFIVSTWTGFVYYIPMTGGKTQLLDMTGEKKNTADIDWIPAKNILLIPTFYGHSVMAYTINGL